MENNLEETYKSKKSHFILILFFAIYFAYQSCFALYGLLSNDILNNDKQCIFISLIILLGISIFFTWKLWTRFHTVRICLNYLYIGNYRFYYSDMSISPMADRLVKYKLAHLITVKEKHKYSFFVVINENYQKPKKYYFQSNCYADFHNLYNALTEKIKPLQ
jgi:hypothetical protein